MGCIMTCRNIEILEWSGSILLTSYVASLLSLLPLEEHWQNGRGAHSYYFYTHSKGQGKQERVAGGVRNGWAVDAGTGSGAVAEASVGGRGWWFTDWPLCSPTWCMLPPSGWSASSAPLGLLHYLLTFGQDARLLVGLPLMVFLMKTRCSFHFAMNCKMIKMFKCPNYATMLNYPKLWWRLP